MQRTSTRTIDLQHEQRLLVKTGPGTRIRVIYGGVWLSADGQTHDRFPVAGEEVTVPAGGRPVLQSIGRTRIELVSPLPRCPVRRLLLRLRALVGGRQSCIGACAARCPM